MRVAILSSVPRHFASLCVPALVADPHIELVLTVQNVGQPTRRRPSFRRKLRKMLKIGLLGALSGLRMRAWFNDSVTALLAIEELDEVCRRDDVRYETTPRVNCETTRRLFREADLDLGLSLGNGWIGPRLFGIPRHGMINVHHEVLPRYRGARSVVWQIHDGSRETGFTIHQIERDIDAGKILHQERLPIEFRENLAATTSHNYARLLQASAAALPRVARDYANLERQARAQGRAPSYTTPTFRQYRRMVRQHDRLAAKRGPHG